ncbi:MAG: ribonuclease III [Chitinophagales bacterium]|nr:ribonuclease III [Chitinophagales bacterium]MDW8418474.1 ribonuclease III [Chitinophagales bacterium]
MIRKVYNRLFSSKKELASFIESVTGIVPSQLKLYEVVFQHRSLFADPKENNERLELLGDSVLDAIICDYLYKKYPYKEEGFITELRSRIVNRATLNEIGERLGLLEKLKYNRKGMSDSAKDLAGNTFEALVGAVYLDAGFDKTARFIKKRILQNMLDVDALQETNTDYKSRIYHYVQREGKSIRFRVAQEKQKNKKAYFVIHLEIDGRLVAQGEGYSKKAAEQAAAMKALVSLGEIA